MSSRHMGGGGGREESHGFSCTVRPKAGCQSLHKANDQYCSFMAPDKKYKGHMHVTNLVLPTKPQTGKSLALFPVPRPAFFVACSTVKRGGPGSFPNVRMAKFSERGHYVLRVIQLPTLSPLGEYDSRPSCCSETHYVHIKLPVFLPLSTLDVTHVRKCTRPSPLQATKSWAWNWERG